MLLYKHPKREETVVLDVGCGTEWPMLTAFHSNGALPGGFMGVDARDCSRQKPNLKIGVEFQQVDVTKALPQGYPLAIVTNTGIPQLRQWDMITCFEVLEHMPKESGLKLLDNLAGITNNQTLTLLSTPCFSEQAGMAENHVYEWKYEELKEELEKRFVVTQHFGTFASLKDYMPLMNEAELKLLARLREYYNTALISCMMAPLYPEKARNCLWHLRRK